MTAETEGSVAAEERVDLRRETMGAERELALEGLFRVRVRTFPSRDTRRWSSDFDAIRFSV